MEVDLYIICSYYVLKEIEYGNITQMKPRCTSQHAVRSKKKSNTKSIFFSIEKDFFGRGYFNRAKTFELIVSKYLIFAFK